MGKAYVGSFHFNREVKGYEPDSPETFAALLGEGILSLYFS
jgi:hypothetical protein